MKYGILALSQENADRIIAGEPPLQGKNTPIWSETLLGIDEKGYFIAAVKTRKGWIRPSQGNYRQPLGKMYEFDGFREISEEEAVMILFGAVKD